MGKKYYGIVALCSLSALYFLLYGAWQHRSVGAVAALQASPPTVVIDAGHGGEDSGALSVTGARESDINLSISLKVEQVLGLCGIDCRMIRTDDTAVSSQGETVRERKFSDLNNRIKLINSINCGVLVSIHQNHFPESKYYGAQVFYADTNGSKKLAEGMQELLRSAVNPSNRREIKRADSVYIMKKINCAGILVECGFLSNSEEEALLRDSVYQKKLSGVICCALARYFDEGKIEVET